MNIVWLAQLIGTLSIFVLFCLKFWIAVNPNTTKKTLRIAILWTSIYVFFLFVLRLLSLFNLGTQDQRIIISGLTSLIPLTAVIVQLFIQKKLDEELEKTR